jgi:MFS family permease
MTTVAWQTRRRPAARVSAFAAVAFLLCLAASSLKNTVQVFFVPIADGFDVSRASLAWSTSLFALTFAVASPLVGALADQIGPRRVLTWGTGLAGLTFAACAWAPTVGVFALIYGLAAATAYSMLSYVPVGVLVDEVFPSRRKGFFYGLLTNGWQRLS